VLSACVFVLIPTSAEAQNRSQARDSVFSIIGAKDKRVEIPFELINNLVVIEASLNGSTPMKFILDTGVGTTIISSLPVGEEIYLPNSRVVSLTGLGEGESVEAIYTNNNTLGLGRVQAENLEVLYLKENIFMLSSFMGTEVHGIIGYDMFASFAVELNYRAKEIYIYDTDEFEEKFQKLPNHRKWFKYPIHIEEKKPYINLVYQHKKDSDPTEIRLLIDSGSSNAFSLYDLTHEAIDIPKNRIETLIGVGLSGRVKGYLGRINMMQLGKFEFTKPVIAYPDSFAIRHAFGVGDRNGSLGGEVLRRFKVIFHFQDEYILMRKNRDFGDKFYYNLSGIEVNTPFPDLPVYVVSDIREASPADKAGVKTGDIIRFINGENVSKKDLNEVLYELQKNESSKIVLEVQRDSVYVKVNLKLENKLKVDD
jgi:hypothetical protein